jgi:hypothetical protein
MSLLFGGGASTKFGALEWEPRQQRIGGKGTAMTQPKTKPFDPAEYLDDSESIAAYMTEALETGDPAFVADALGVIARARGLIEKPAKPLF